MPRPTNLSPKTMDYFKQIPNDPVLSRYRALKDKYGLCCAVMAVMASIALVLAWFAEII